MKAEPEKAEVDGTTLPTTPVTEREERWRGDLEELKEAKKARAIERHLRRRYGEESRFDELDVELVRELSELYKASTDAGQFRRLISARHPELHRVERIVRGRGRELTGQIYVDLQGGHMLLVTYDLTSGKLLGRSFIRPQKPRVRLL